MCCQVHICCQNSVLGEMAKSSSHLVIKRCIVESLYVNGLYNLELIFWGVVILLIYTLVGGSHSVLTLDFRTDLAEDSEGIGLSQRHIFGLDLWKCYVKNVVEMCNTFLFPCAVLLNWKSGLCQIGVYLQGATVEFVILFLSHQALNCRNDVLKEVMVFMLVLRNGRSNGEISLHVSCSISINFVILFSGVGPVIDV